MNAAAPTFDAAAFDAAERHLDRLEEEGRRRAKSSSAAPNQGGGAGTIAARAAFEARKSTIKNVAVELFTVEGTDQSDKQIEDWTVEVVQPAGSNYWNGCKWCSRKADRYNYQDPHGNGVYDKNGMSRAELMSAFREFTPNVDDARTVAVRNSSADGQQGARNAGGGGLAAVKEHERRRRARVIRRPDKLFAAISASLVAMKVRLGEFADFHVRRVLSRIPMVVKPGIEYRVVTEREIMPAWIKKSIHEKWRWLSGERCLGGFNLQLLESISGLFLSAQTLGAHHRKLQNSVFAPIGATVAMKARPFYVGSALVGAVGEVRDKVQGSRKNARLVKWTPADGSPAFIEELPASFLWEAGGREGPKPTRETCCDRCRTRGRACAARDDALAPALAPRSRRKREMKSVGEIPASRLKQNKWRR